MRVYFSTPFSRKKLLIVSGFILFLIIVYFGTRGIIGQQLISRAESFQKEGNCYQAIKNSQLALWFNQKPEIWTKRIEIAMFCQDDKVIDLTDSAWQKTRDKKFLERKCWFLIFEEKNEAQKLAEEKGLKSCLGFLAWLKNDLTKAGELLAQSQIKGREDFLGNIALAKKSKNPLYQRQWLGLSWAQNTEWLLAKKVLEKNKNKEQKDWWLIMGKIDWALGQSESAKQHFLKAIEIDPLLEEELRTFLD